MPEWKLANVAELGFKTRPPVSKACALNYLAKCLLRLKIFLNVRQ